MHTQPPPGNTDSPNVDFLLQPELTEINRLPARPPLQPHKTIERARSAGTSTWRRSIDGNWRFLLCPSPKAAPIGWQTRSPGDPAWSSLAVPGCWTRQGVDDLPHYTNVVMPWQDLEPPQTPAKNPTGLYRTEIELSKSWLKRDVVLHLGAAESVAVLWCNGHFVGMGKDSRLPSEFDITPFANAGINEIAVMVIRYSDATWIEDQDHWWHGGIHRSCFIEARGRTRVDDLSVMGDYSPTQSRGSLKVTVRAVGQASTVRVSIETARGRKVAQAACPFVDFDHSSLLGELIAAHHHKGPIAELSFDDLNVNPWSPEAPSRYRVITELLGPDSNVIEVLSTWTGFRRVEIKDRRLLINGVPTVIHGVNRHDHHPHTGKVVSTDEIRAELIMMKRHNINAVRTAHYPNDHTLLDLCDELGLYVIDEANVESHARLESLTQDPRYFNAVVERTRRMVARDKNHPCIIGWSLGNESGLGPCHDAAAAWVRAVDPSRFVHYEGAVHPRFGDIGNRAAAVQAAPLRRERLVTDVVCPMYPSIDTIVGWARWAERTQADDRPMLLCEFSHAMGNSNGSLDGYVNAFYDEPALAGGFVWDWRDQGLDETAENGKHYWAFGGHFRDEPNDANFCINGLVGPDLTAHPALREYQWLSRPVVVSHLGGRKIKVTNRRQFTATDDLKLRWTASYDGNLTATGVLDVSVAPGMSKNVTLPAAALKEPLTHLDIQFEQRRSNAVAKRGHVVAWDQLLMAPAPDRATMPSPRRSRCREQLHLELNDAGIASLATNTTTLVSGDITGCLWRPPTDNDGIKQGWMAEVGRHAPRWRSQGLDTLHSALDHVTETSRKGVRTITLHRRLVGTEAEASHTTKISLDANYARFDERIELPEAWQDLPRVGVRFEMPEQFGNLHWLGLGPDETYPDRHSAATHGLWNSLVADQYHPYVVPQEHGSHHRTSWFELTNHAGTGARMTSPAGSMAFAARYHHDAGLTKAKTIADLETAPSVEVHIDAAMRGLGTAICGPDALPAYRISKSTHRWRWLLEAF